MGDFLGNFKKIKIKANFWEQSDDGSSPYLAFFFWVLLGLRILSCTVNLLTFI